ncbi:hypothetical protein 000TH009_209 [Bacillus phage 000TH009]|nr:hypothetical protein 000TH009_209 [Bacillus phage 000TH009]
MKEKREELENEEVVYEKTDHHRLVREVGDDYVSDVVKKHEEDENVTAPPTFKNRVYSVLWDYDWHNCHEKELEKEGKVSFSPKVRDYLYSAPNLKEVVTAQPTEDDYRDVLVLLAALVRVTYGNYKFALYKSTDETEQENFMQIVCPYEEHKWLHDKIFKQTIKKGIDMKTLQEKFADRVIAGDVLDLGEGITILKHDSDGRLITSVSPINSGLEGTEITFIFSFVKTENYEAWKKNKFKEEEVEGESGNE